jgi:hypothetical protein
MGGQPGGELLAFAHSPRGPPGQAGHPLGVDVAERGGDDRDDHLVGAGASAVAAGSGGAGLAVDALQATPAGGWGLAAGADHPRRALVAKPPAPTADSTGRGLHAPRAGLDQRAGQLEYPAAASLPGRKARAVAKAVFQLDQRPRRRGDRAHHPSERGLGERGLQPCQDGDDPAQPLPITPVLLRAATGTVAGLEFQAAGSGVVGFGRGAGRGGNGQERRPSSSRASTGLSPASR